jgi:hypothetical protein
MKTTTKNPARKPLIETVETPASEPKQAILNDMVRTMTRTLVNG